MSIIKDAKLYLTLFSISISIGAGVGVILCAMYIHSVDVMVRSYQNEIREIDARIAKRFVADIQIKEMKR